MNDSVPGEVIEFSDQDKQVLADLGVDEAPPYNTILKVWQEILRPAVDESNTKVSPQFATRIIQTYTGLTFSDMNAFRDLYYSRILDLAVILDDEITSDEECLKYPTPEEDSVENAPHYKQLLLDWQKVILQWELDWDTMSDAAAVEIAVISEIHKMFFGQNGITAFLENIRFSFTDADQQNMADALNQLKEASSE